MCSRALPRGTRVIESIATTSRHHSTQRALASWRWWVPRCGASCPTRRRTATTPKASAVACLGAEERALVVRAGSAGPIRRNQAELQPLGIDPGAVSDCVFYERLRYGEVLIHVNRRGIGPDVEYAAISVSADGSTGNDGSGRCHRHCFRGGLQPVRLARSRLEDDRAARFSCTAAAQSRAQRSIAPPS